ncbi:hypothetical protein V2J09_008100 [Rumex salicifolius]
MALEAVVYQQSLFGANRDLYTLQDNWSWDYNSPTPNNQHFQDQEDVQNCYLGCYLLENQAESCCQYNNYDQEQQGFDLLSATAATSSVLSRQPKRRRARCRKNREDIENQRMTHIAVERNRRKQMNEYLSVLKSLMPDSYVQRGDQASIVGGAINFVKELEQNLHFLSAQKKNSNSMAPKKEELPFQEFFSFPQYSTVNSSSSGETSYVADVEVTMVESHANMKIRSRKQPKQLLNLVSGLQGLKLSILHLNVSTADQFALYCLSVGVEENSVLNSADEIATAVHQLLGRIQQGASSSSLS